MWHRIAVALAVLSSGAWAADEVHVPQTARNLLVEATVSSNLASYNLGLRGQPRDVIYDTQQRGFVRPSQWHEYGVGFGKSLGVVSEARPAFWMAEWREPVEVDLVVLSGAYPNQPQPETCWKIEVRRGGQWATHAAGKGGWFDSGRYVWRRAATEPMAIDGFRVSVFSKDGQAPIQSIHFRGEEGLSWLVAKVPPIDAAIELPADARARAEATFGARALAGDIERWSWDFGDGTQATGQRVAHTFGKSGRYDVVLTIAGQGHTAAVRADLAVGPAVGARIAPLAAPVVAGQPVAFSGAASVGPVKTWRWDFGDGTAAEGRDVRHAFAKPGVHQVALSVSDGEDEHSCFALVRAHTDETPHVPQVLLDTDQKNEVDDQHYFAYGLFGELDVLGVNSIHHGGGQEAVNYRELVNVLDLSRKSGLPDHRVCRIFRGADRRLDVPMSGKWDDTQPIVTAASDAILAAAVGACPQNPLWIVPVGPGTNAASAILQARRMGLALKGRVKVMWLGGSNHAITGEFNGNNDPWSMVVVARSGIETWIVPAPVGGRIRMDVRTEAGLYPDNPLGSYLKAIVPKQSKSLYDPACLSAILDLRLGLGWIKEAEPVVVGGPEEGYRWTKTEGSPVRVIRQIDQEAMKRDVFDTLKGRPTRLIGVPVRQ